VRRISSIALAIALAVILTTLTLERPARALDDTVYVATYVEVMPNAVAPAGALLRRYRDASRAEAGNLRFDVLAEIARPNRFVIVEAWSDKAAWSAHTQSAGAAQFREQLAAIQDAPPDVRLDNALYVERGTSEKAAGAVYVVTHIDVIPPGTEVALAALKAMSVDTPKDPGDIEYDVLQQADHANHFTVVEGWTDRAAADAHAMAAHTRGFREKLIPIRGALYDERLYNALD
jgi:quinol monooxygenase YgiN